MNHTLLGSVAVNKAQRHGWKVDGIAFLGNTCYTTLTLRRKGDVFPRFKIAVHPVTGRTFAIQSNDE